MVKMVQLSAGDCFQVVKAVSQMVQSGTKGTGWQRAGKAEAAGGRAPREQLQAGSKEQHCKQSS